jgi:holo-[acyl-carrier protein] synthase
MSILCGVDIVYVPRFRDKIDKYGEPGVDNKFINRIFNQEEIRHIITRSDPYPGLAGRFAAKEATVKAFNKIKRLSNLKDIIIYGEIPELKIENLQLPDFYSSLSISHDGDYAISMVTLELL